MGVGSSACIYRKRRLAWYYFTFHCMGHLPWDSAYCRKRSCYPKKLPLLKVAYSIVVFIFVSLLWQLFIVDSLGSAIQRYASLFDSEPFHGELAVKLVLSSLAYVLLTSSKVFSLIQKSSDNRTFVIAEVSVLAVMLSALILLNCPMSFNFFYFRF